MFLLFAEETSNILGNIVQSSLSEESNQIATSEDLGGSRLFWIISDWGIVPRQYWSHLSMTFDEARKAVLHPSAAALTAQLLLHRFILWVSCIMSSSPSESHYCPGLLQSTAYELPLKTILNLQLETLQNTTSQLWALLFFSCVTAAMLIALIASWLLRAIQGVDYW